MQPKALSSYVDFRRTIFDPKSDCDRVPVAISQDQLIRAAGSVGKTYEPIPFEKGTFQMVFSFETEGGSYVLRVATDKYPAFGLHNEEWAASMARDHRFPVSVPLITDTSRYLVPFDFQILPLVPGKLASELPNIELKRVFGKIAHSLTYLHQASMSHYGPLDPRGLFMNPPLKPRGTFDSWRDYIMIRLGEHVDKCLEIGAMTPAEVEFAEDRIGNVLLQIDFDPVLLHGDLSNNNIIVNGEDVTVIDWESCLVGDPIYELAGWSCSHMPERFSWIIDSYYLHGHKPVDFELRFWTYYLRIAIARTVHRHRFGYKDNPAFPPASERIQLAIEKLRNL